MAGAGAVIVVEIRLVSARTGQTSPLGTITIANDAAASRASGGALGDYAVTLSRRGQPCSVWKRGAVRGFPRKRLGTYDLLFRALREMVGSRNP